VKLPEAKVEVVVEAEETPVVVEAEETPAVVEEAAVLEGEEAPVEETVAVVEEEETAPVTWTVYYWGNIMYRAAPLMLMLEDAGVQWEWQPPMNRPEDSSFAVPTLESSDGAVVGQAVSALAYAGKKLGYVIETENDEEWAVLLQAALDAADFISELSNPSENMFECNFPTCSPGVSRAEMWFNYLEGRVAGPYMMGEDIKFADFEVFTALTLWSKMHGEKADEVLAKYPKLTGLVEAVGSRPAVAAFCEDKVDSAPIDVKEKPFAWAPKL